MLNLKMNMPFYLMVFYGSIMISTVLILRGLLKNRLPKFVFPILWSVILLRLLVPFSLSSPLSMKVPAFAQGNPFDTAIAQNTAITEDISTEMPYIAQGTAIAEDIPTETTYQDVTFSSSAEDETATNRIQEAVAEETAFEAAYSDYGLQNSYIPIVLFIYFIGILVTAGILLTQKYNYSKHLKNSLLVEHNETINTLLREMDMGHILVFTNDTIASPLVSGLIAPRIYLPTRMDFSNAELLRHILCHETMHIRRKDNWLKTIMLITLCIHWFNPLVWIMSRYLASDLEMACDEAVLHLYNCNDDAEEAKKNYAFSLLAMAISGSRPTLLYSAFSKTEVEKRIQNILHYQKASALLLAFSICLVLSGSVAFATGGQAPFYPELTPFCSADSCRWGVRASLTRDASLGKNAQDRAETVIFGIMHADTTNDPDILNEQIIAGLSSEFHVEKNAFVLDMSLCLNDEELYAEYEKWGLIRKDAANNLLLLYNGETIRTFSDRMIGRYMSQQEGAVDLTIERNRLGEIVAVNVFREGDTEYDRRTEKQNRNAIPTYPISDGAVTETDGVIIHNYSLP